METIKEINTFKTKVVFVFKLILLTTISYVKAQDFIVTDNGVRSLNRDPDTRKDFANVFYKPKNCRFYPIKGVVEIIGLDNTEPEDMKKTAQIIEEYFGYETFISKNVSLQDDNYLFNTEIIDGETFINNYKKNSLTIYITNKNIQALNIDVRGVSRIKGSVILLQNGIFMHETLIHEMGHIFGLYHCDNLRCVMAIKNDEYDEGKFCDKCINNLVR